MSLAYLTDIIILLTAAVVTVPMARFAGLGTVPGFLIAGMIVGPSALGFIENQVEIGHLAELGVVLLLFIVGIELKPSRLWLMRRLVFGLGLLQVAVTGGVITAVAYFIFGLDLGAAVLIGPALALSSTAFVLQLLNEQKMLTSKYGRTSIAILLFQDLAVVPLLALASLLTVAGMSVEMDIGLALLEALLILSLIILGGRFFLQPILHRIARLDSPEIFTASAVLLVLGSAVLTARFGLSMAMGAFVAGLLVADSEFRHQVTAEIQPFRGLLIGLFFMSMGMSLDLKVFYADPLVFIGLALALLATKAVLLWLMVRMFGHKGGFAWAIALLLAQSGEFALVLFGVAFSTSLLSDVIFQKLLVVVVLTMLATPILAGFAHRLVLSKKVKAQDHTPMDENFEDSTVVIAGFGRVGHRVGQMFEMRDVPYLAIDNNADTVKRHRASGRSVFYGDARQPDVLRSLGVGDAGLIIVTIDDLRATEQVVASLHRTFPGLNILARGHNLEHCKSLYMHGAWLAVSENLEASVALATAALSHIKADEEENLVVIDRFRKSYYSKTSIEDQQLRCATRVKDQ